MSNAHFQLSFVTNSVSDILITRKKFRKKSAAIDERVWASPMKYCHFLAFYYGYRNHDIPTNNNVKISSICKIDWHCTVDNIVGNVLAILCRKLLDWTFMKRPENSNLWNWLRFLFHLMFWLHYYTKKLNKVNVPTPTYILIYNGWMYPNVLLKKLIFFVMCVYHSLFHSRKNNPFTKRV